MITATQTRSIIILANGQGVSISETDLFSLTEREAERILRRLRKA